MREGAVQSMSLSLVTAPAVEPITLVEAKAHLRVDFTDEDTLISSLITAARQHAERVTRRQLVTATWRLSLDAFPSRTTLESIHDRVAIDVPLPPLQSVSSITYIDIDGTSTTLSASAYTVDAYHEPGRIVPAYGYSWPSTRSQVNAVTVQFVAGYGLAASVPESIKAAIKLIVGHLYENREEVVTGTITAQLPMAAENLLAAETFGAYCLAY